jgi:hypothetical protein
MNVPVKAMTMLSAASAVLSGSFCLAEAGQSLPLKPLNQEMTQGEVRVVLLRAGKVSSSEHEAQWVVTYGIEVPQKGAFSDLGFSSADEVTLAVKGKAVEGLGGWSSGAMGFDDLPDRVSLKNRKLPGKGDDCRGCRLPRIEN